MCMCPSVRPSVGAFPKYDDLKTKNGQKWTEKLEHPETLGQKWIQIIKNGRFSDQNRQTFEMIAHRGQKRAYCWRKNVSFRWDALNSSVEKKIQFFQNGHFFDQNHEILRSKWPKRFNFRGAPPPSLPNFIFARFNFRGAPPP